MNITLTQLPMKVEAGTQSIPQLPRMANLPMALAIVSDDADFTGITTWTFTVAENHSQDTTPMLFVDSGFTVNNKTVSFDLITNTEEVADYLGSRMKRNAVAQLRGFKAGQTTAALTVSFWVTLCNIIPDGSSTIPTPIAAFYTAAQTDAAIAAALATIVVPSDLNELTDNDGLLFSGSYDDLSNRPTIPSDLNELSDEDDKLHGPIKEVATLPTVTVAGQMIRLTAADDAAKAAPGVYMHDGVGWTCISYEAAYALGNLGATPTLALIPGAAYTATVNVEITSFTVAFTRPGLCSITLTNVGTLAVAQPSMTGRTSKLLAEGAWDGVATALSKALIEDDGTYLVVSAGGLA